MEACTLLSDWFQETLEELIPIPFLTRNSEITSVRKSKIVRENGFQSTTVNRLSGRVVRSEVCKLPT